MNIYYIYNWVSNKETSLVNWNVAYIFLSVYITKPWSYYHRPNNFRLILSLQREDTFCVRILVWLLWKYGVEYPSEVFQISVLDSSIDMGITYWLCLHLGSKSNSLSDGSLWFSGDGGVIVGTCTMGGLGGTITVKTWDITQGMEKENYFVSINQS